jgi:LuxR family transcriptional regulator, maltose regulon positive regulatory protein
MTRRPRCGPAWTRSSARSRWSAWAAPRPGPPGRRTQSGTWSRASRLARQVRRPYLEFSGLAYLAAAQTGRSFARAAERSRQAIELAGRHGWTDEPALGIACFALGSTLTWQGRLEEEAEPWVQRAARIVGADADPRAGTKIHYVRGILELARGRAADALAGFRAAERLARRLAPAHLLVPQARAMLVQALVRPGETERAEQILDGLGEHERADGQTRIATAVPWLAQHDPSVAAVALAPLLDGSAPVLPRVWQAHTFLLEAIVRDPLGDPAASGRAPPLPADQPDRAGDRPGAVCLAQHGQDPHAQSLR